MLGVAKATPSRYTRVLLDKGTKMQPTIKEAVQWVLAGDWTLGDLAMFAMAEKLNFDQLFELFRELEVENYNSGYQTGYQHGREDGREEGYTVGLQDAREGI